ncbi:MAG: hypothetical protein M1820_009267 [Bogoriella megaspora]|nr:MAG: hypothetical protein M1820_009267 [Bogoriella megaspora]
MLPSRTTRFLARGHQFLPLTTHRYIRTSPSQFYPRKDAQGKDDIVVEPNEYSKSGSDVQSAQSEKAAYDPSTTSPEEEQNIAGQEAGPVRQKPTSSDQNNPLDVSPANQGVSQPRSGTEGGPEGSAAETGGSEGRVRSGRGSPSKSGGGQYGGGGSG